MDIAIDRAAGRNAYGDDAGLRRALGRTAPALAAAEEARLMDFGAWVAGPLEEEAAFTDRHGPPVLEAFDRDGGRAGRVIVNPLYAAAHAEAYRRGVVGLAHADPPRPHVLSFVMGYLLSTADISIHCPVTMTGAVAHVLAGLPAGHPARRALPDLVAMDGTALSGGTWATERHGGSDVGATTTEAVADGAHWRLTGLKWFASNAGSGWALATARPRGSPAGGKGLGCYLVPARLADGTPNRLWVRRLKDKLGTRGLPTGEIELDGASAIEVASPPEGLKAMMDALEYSRIHNAAGAAGLQARALAEALAWAFARHAFGRPVRDFPAVRDDLLDLLAMGQASLHLFLEAGLAFDAALKDQQRQGWLRTTTALAKAWTAEEAVRAATRAVEIVGGNGYTEEWPTARLYRDALVTAVWEGPANIQALEMVRAVSGRLAGDTAFAARVGGILAAAPPALAAVRDPLAAALAEVQGAFARLRRAPEEAARIARPLAALAADVLAGALLLEGASQGLASGDGRDGLIAGRFVARRFGRRHGGLDGPDEAHRRFDEVFAEGVVRP
jgi:alkylation response protein AidB-like acyl-CoA dehydrogenase